jgi:hypothetical protein
MNLNRRFCYVGTGRYGVEEDPSSLFGSEIFRVLEYEMFQFQFLFPPDSLCKLD